MIVFLVVMSGDIDEGKAKTCSYIIKHHNRLITIYTIGSRPTAHG